MKEVEEDLISKKEAWVLTLHKSSKCSLEVNLQVDLVVSMMISEVEADINSTLEEDSQAVDSHRVEEVEVVLSHLTLAQELTSNFSKRNNNFND